MTDTTAAIVPVDVIEDVDVVVACIAAVVVAVGHGSWCTCWKRWFLDHT